MERILTMVAFALAALFICWVLFTDPAEEDSVGDTNIIGAVVILPLIGLLLAGVAIALPIILAVVFAVAVIALIWWLTAQVFLHIQKDPAWVRELRQLSDTVMTNTRQCIERQSVKQRWRKRHEEAKRIRQQSSDRQHHHQTKNASASRNNVIHRFASMFSNSNQRNCKERTTHQQTDSQRHKRQQQLWWWHLLSFGMFHDETLDRSLSPTTRLSDVVDIQSLHHIGWRTRESVNDL